MTARRLMADTMSEVADAALDASTALICATRIEVDLPVELGLRGGALEAELPRFLTRTDFDTPIARLRFVWERQP